MLQIRCDAVYMRPDPIPFGALQSAHKVPVRWDPPVLDLIRRRCDEVEATLTSTALPEISREILARRKDGRPIETIHIGAGFTFSFA
jgi:hypothetical protein